MKLDEGQKQETSLLDVQSGKESSHVFKQDGRTSGHGTEDADAVEEADEAVVAATAELPEEG